MVTPGCGLQKQIDPSRDWSALAVKPDVMVNPAAAKSKDQRPRCQLLFRVGMMRAALLQGESTVLDLCVTELSGSVQADGEGGVDGAVQVAQVEVMGSGKQGSRVPYRLLSQCEEEEAASTRSSADSKGQDPLHAVACFSLRVASSAGGETMCELQMPQEFSLRIDPHTVAACSRLQAQVLDVWRNLRDRSSSAAAARLQVRGEGKGSRPVVLVEVESVPEQLLAQEEKLGGAGRRRRVSTTLQAVGLHLLLIDDSYQELMLLNMHSVSVVKTDFADGMVAVSGTLGKLEIVDESAPTSLHPKFLTTASEEKAALVKVDVEVYDKTSVAGAATRENVWQVGIFRPRITLLWRFIAEMLQYQQNFFATPSNAADELPGAHEPDEGSSQTKAHLPSPRQPAARAAAGHRPGGGSSKGGPSSLGSTVKINLEHPEVILPRSSTCKDAFLADLGRVDVERASRHSSERWSVSFKETHLDTRQESATGEGITRQCVKDLDGAASISFCEAGAASGEAEMSVDVTLQHLKGTITNCQYALLMSIVGENFTEKRVLAGDAASPAKPIRRQVSHLAEDGTLGDKLGGIIDLARGLTAHRVPSSAYNLSVKEVELALNCWDGDVEDVDRTRQEGHGGGVRPLLHASAADLRVRYESYADTGGESGGLASSCTAQLAWFELADTRVGAVHKSGPLFCVRKPGAARRNQRAEHSSGEAGTPHAAAEHVRPAAQEARQASIGRDADHDELIVLQYFRLMHGHTGIDLMMRNVDTVFDIGLLMNAISWLGTSNGPAVSGRGFSYVVTRAGGFRLQVDLPDSSIQLVTAFDRADADGFDMSGAVSVTYASSASEDVLHVKVDDLVLRVRELVEGGGAKANRDMDIVRPCGVMASWQWYRQLDAATAASISGACATVLVLLPPWVDDQYCMHTCRGAVVAVARDSPAGVRCRSARARPQAPAEILLGGIGDACECDV